MVKKKIITNNIQIFQTSDVINQVTSYTNMAIGGKHSLPQNVHKEMLGHYKVSRESLFSSIKQL